MAGDIEAGIEVGTHHWQCSGCDRLCAADLPASVGYPGWSCTEASPMWRKIPPEEIHKANVKVLSTGRMIHELKRRGATWMEFLEGDTLTMTDEYNPPTKFQGPMTVLIIQRGDL
ncbi:MAG: hypothetical protein PHH09_03980 [Methanoregulaceae archaeon]|nr:hypothetical protein [Methanoregulaceae archaeon]